MFDKLRMAEWAAGAVLLLCILWLLAPQQLPVILYKLALVALFAHVGYWIDRRLFPYARPYDADGTVLEGYARAELRRAIVVAAVILAGALAL